ncbi:MAG: ABC transporter ATP-binding protein [Dehalococcoidia bacterium]|nr:ABC transporter ATP-binding protein [Dehalococcoidia bacterium]
MIVARDLYKRYEEIRAVDGISFEVRRGEVFGMLGPNGAGKTTTVEILEGMRDADSGEAVINGINVKEDPRAVKSMIGVQLQQNAFFDNLKLSEIVELYARLYEAKVDPVEVLTRVGLEGRKNGKYAQLSGGQKQRLSIAVALVNDPVVLFLDEPTTGLDPQARRQVWALVNKIREDGSTILLTTHYMEEAEELCDRVAVVEDGKIIALDTPDNLIDQLLETGFKSEKRVREATLDDVFLNLTGHDLRD